MMILMFNESYQGFPWFGLSHLLSILWILVCIVLMVVFRDKITGKTDLYLRQGVALLMIMLEWTFYGWSLSKGGFQTSLLPLGVCAISMYVTAYTLWTKNEKIFKIVFPWAISGALLSLIIADLGYNFPHFRFIHYFGNHGLFLLGNIYLLVVAKFKFTYKDLLKSSLILLIYSIVIYPLNFLLDSNHLFLREIPHEVAPLYAFLGDFWVIGFMVSIALLFQLIYVPFLLKRQRG